MFIVDNINNVVRQITTSTGIITTIAGNGYNAGLHSGGFSGDGGQATAAEFFEPANMVFDATGNIYISDVSNNRIRMINTTGVISTIAGSSTLGSFGGDGGQATAANLYYPSGLIFDATGNLYIADGANNRIRKINTSGIITTIVGTGTAGYSGDGGQGTAAELSNPYGVIFDATGNLYISDFGNNRIRKVNTSGIITTIAGTGTSRFSGDGGQATAAKIFHPSGITFDVSGNLYISDEGNSRIRTVNTSGIITTIIGTGTAGYSGDEGQATVAEVNATLGITFDVSGNLYIADQGNNRIRKVTPSPTSTSTITPYNVSVSPSTICAGQTATIHLSGSQTGVYYGVVATTNTTTIVGGIPTVGTETH